MIDEKDRSPMLKRKSFYCPHCGAFSDQDWSCMFYAKEIPENVAEIDRRNYHGKIYKGSNPELASIIINAFLACCNSCGGISIWTGQKMIYPKRLLNELPHHKMPEEVKEIYEEARKIASDSPRAAAALLRKSIEILCIHLGCEEKNLFSMINELKGKVSKDTIELLSYIRILGNDSIHSVSEINFKEDASFVPFLFKSVNRIVREAIEEPEEKEEMKEKLSPKLRKKLFPSSETPSP